MTGSHAVFIYLDVRMRGMVRFGEDSDAEIEGQGKV
jgi:hypothetical protein